MKNSSLTPNFTRILEHLLTGSLGHAETESVLRDRIVDFVDDKIDETDLYADIEEMHGDWPYEIFKVSYEDLRRIMQRKGFEAFLKAVKTQDADRPNYPAVRLQNGYFRVFLPDKTYEDVPYGGEFDDYREFDRYLEYARPDHPVVYHIAHNKDDEFIIVLDNRDEYIVI